MQKRRKSRFPGAASKIPSFSVRVPIPKCVLVLGEKPGVEGCFILRGLLRGRQSHAAGEQTTWLPWPCLQVLQFAYSVLFWCAFSLRKLDPEEGPFNHYEIQSTAKEENSQPLGSHRMSLELTVCIESGRIFFLAHRFL